MEDILLQTLCKSFNQIYLSPSKIFFFLALFAVSIMGALYIAIFD
jgi:hypothetical protein